MQISFIISIIVSILALSLIIFIHEAGHFIFAKIFNVAVLEFSIGMGPRLFSFIKNNTRYSIKAIPFGGSCAMVGEDPAGSGDFLSYDVKKTEDGKYDFDGVILSKEDVIKKNLAHTSPYKKLLICFAGPMFNFLLAFIISIALVSMNGVDKPYIASVRENSPASIGIPYAIKEGDLIKKLETTTESQNINLSREITIFIYMNNKSFVDKKNPLSITFERDNKTYQTIVYPQYDDEMKKSIIGISLSNKIYKPQNISEIITYAFFEVKLNINSTIKSLKMLFTGLVAATEISGPVGTVAIMGGAINEASSFGLFYALIAFLDLIVLISSNLGVMNLLPIPALDGGRIVFALYEMITRKRVNAKVEMIVNSITMILLLLLMAFIFGNDILRLAVGA